MTLRKWFAHKPAWLRGGIVGVIVCILLFVFYVTVYFKVIDYVYRDGLFPNTALLLPFATGHLFPLFSHFVFEGTSVEETFSFWGMSIVLTAIYFSIGAGIGWWRGKK